MDYEAVIGLEVHVQLNTKAKMFTRVAYRYGEPPNSLTNPVVMGMPGTLPVMNRAAIEKSICVGLLFDCQIADVCKWDRKHYWYPDMPKNYQISQYDQPICIGGKVEIELPGKTRNVMGEHKWIPLTRIHLEEDVAKITHFEKDSLVDYNRAGAPLIEIVSEPEMENAEEAFAFLTSLRMHLISAGLSDCDMEKGQMRCDANVSIRPVGSEKLGTKVELKNMNTFSGVRAGLEYEIARQVRLVRSGGEVIQETRRWNAEQGYTVTMRTKEESHDYRYFPDPDLMPVRIDEEWKTTLKGQLPERPFDTQRRFFEQYDLPYTITSVLCSDRVLVDFFETAVATHHNPRAIANFMANDLRRELGSTQTDHSQPKSLSDRPIHPGQLADLVALIDSGAISRQTAQDVFREWFKTGEDPECIIDRRGLRQTSDTGELEDICSVVIKENTAAVDQFKSGKENAINALKGQVMRATRGKANPQLVDEILRKLMS